MQAHERRGWGRAERHGELAHEVESVGRVKHDVFAVRRQLDAGSDLHA
jgi:hypothetical protein